MKFLGSANIRSDYNRSKAVIIPVPYEKTTSYGKGTVKGPQAILNASDHLEHYDIEEDRVTSNIGISTLPALKNIKNTDELFAKVKKVTDKVLMDKKMPVYLGGEHTITAAIVSAFRERHADFGVLHMDAHSDMRDVYDGTKYSHACVMRRVYQMKVSMVSVGIRSQCSAEHDFIKIENINIFYANQILNNKDWIQKVIELLDNNFYLTFDVDVIDPSCMPATGTPEPGGLMWQDVMCFFQALAKSKKRMIGMDIVELAPIKGNHAPDFLCAKLIYKILTLFVR